MAPPALSLKVEEVQSIAGISHGRTQEEHNGTLYQSLPPHPPPHPAGAALRWFQVTIHQTVVLLAHDNHYLNDDPVQSTYSTRIQPLGIGVRGM